MALKGRCTRQVFFFQTGGGNGSKLSRENSYCLGQDFFILLVLLLSKSYGIILQFFSQIFGQTLLTVLYSKRPNDYWMKKDNHCTIGINHPIKEI